MTRTERKDFSFQIGTNSLRKLICFAILLSAILTIAFSADKHPPASTICPLVHGKGHPPPEILCNGKNRSNYAVWDTRAVFNMTARKAFGVISAIHKAEGDCSKAVLEGKAKIPILNIRFESSAFQSTANVAIRTANLVSDLLTRGACAGDLDNPRFYGNPTWNMSDDFFYSVVKSNMQHHKYMLGSGIWFLNGKYKNRTYFAPYAYRQRGDDYIRIKDLSTTWGKAHTEFLTHLEGVANNRTFMCKSSYFTPPRKNATDSTMRHVTHPVADQSDSMWSRPYFECSTTKSWIVGFFVPFFFTRYDKPADDPLEMMGVASVDIDLSKVDINQCDPDGTSSFTYKIFAGTHHCHNKTSKCVHIPGKGFSVGSYKCVCRNGYFFPNKGAKNMFFNGTKIEQHFSVNISHNNHDEFRCLPCKKGCQTCVDGSPCVVEADPVIKWTVLGFTVFCILMVIGISIFVWRCRELQVVKSASPLFLMISLFGAGLMYLEAIALFQEPSDEWCTVAPWLQHIGFALMYGSLLLKTWRISLIFKIRSAKRVKVDDFGLLQRLIPIVLLYVVYLVIWTVAKQPSKSEYKTRDNLKATACSEDWWNHSLLIVDILMLFWGIHLCYTVRKAPTKFNESKFISWSIYNMTVCIIFMKLMKTFLFIDLGPNIVYLLEFIRMQLSVTVLIILVFFPKIIRVLKGRGDQAENTSRSRSAGGGSSDGTMHLVQENETLKAEITRLYGQLETMKSAKLEAGNRTYASRSGSISSGLSMRSTSHGPSNNTSTTTLANGWRHGGSQFFSPAAELMPNPKSQKEAKIQKLRHTDVSRGRLNMEKVWKMGVSYHVLPWVPEPKVFANSKNK